MIIDRYSKIYEDSLFDMMKDEGEDWQEYYGENGRPNYIKALESSVAYVALEDGAVAGYARCREDSGFGVYVYDLLVKKSFRGRQIGKALIDRVVKDYEGQAVYVMSDVDGYYEKLGYHREGSVFRAKI